MGVQHPRLKCDIGGGSRGAEGREGPGVDGNVGVQDRSQDSISFGLLVGAAGGAGAAGCGLATAALEVGKA